MKVSSLYSNSYHKFNQLWHNPFPIETCEECCNERSDHLQPNCDIDWDSLKPPGEPYEPRNTHYWNPDPEFYKQFEYVVMMPPGDEWKQRPNPNGRFLPPVDRTFRTKMINFGPAHPAAHGVLG